MSSCPLCERDGAKMERHHLQTKRKDKADVEEICRECHKTIHGLFSQRELRDGRLGLDSVDGLLANERMQKAITFIKKLAPGSTMPMRQATTRRRRA